MEWKYGGGERETLGKTEAFWSCRDTVGRAVVGSLDGKKNKAIEKETYREKESMCK